MGTGAWLKSNFKKGNVDRLNFRSVSLSSIISKCFQHLIAHAIHGFLDEHTLLFQDQDGFRVDHRCDIWVSNTITDLTIFYGEVTTDDYTFL